MCWRFSYNFHDKNVKNVYDCEDFSFVKDKCSVRKNSFAVKELLTAILSKRKLHRSNHKTKFGWYFKACNYDDDLLFNFVLDVHNYCLIIISKISTDFCKFSHWERSWINVFLRWLGYVLLKTNTNIKIMNSFKRKRKHSFLNFTYLTIIQTFQLENSASEHK